MTSTGPLLFILAIAVVATAPLLVGMKRNFDNYEAETRSSEKERISAEGFGLAMPIAVGVVIICLIVMNLF